MSSAAGHYDCIQSVSHVPQRLPVEWRELTQIQLLAEYSLNVLERSVLVVPGDVCAVSDEPQEVSSSRRLL